MTVYDPGRSFVIELTATTPKRILGLRINNAMDAPIPATDVRLTVRHHGHAPAAFGPGAYKVSRGAVRWLLSSGWREVGSGKKYVYLERPPKNSSKEAFDTTVCVPSKKQLLVFSAYLHSIGKEWQGRIGEWSARYQPAENSEFSWTVTNVEPFSTHKEAPIRHTSAFKIGAQFLVGHPDVWFVKVEWIDGQQQYHEKAEYAPNLLLDFDGNFYEGAIERSTTNRYERSRAAREVCLAYHGTCCSICLIDFGKVYGELARGFIHVHHITPLSSVGGEYEVDPINDLIPVCPNCHSVLHLTDPPSSVDDLRRILGRS